MEDKDKPGARVLEHKRIVVGVTGGIAAYKTADLVRRLRADEADIKVIMTRSAQAFLGPLTLQALSGNPVYTELLSEGSDAGMQHIELARWCDLILVTPASANFMAKLAHGLADDLLTTVCLASTRPILVAPAMNREMWLAAATQENKQILEQRGVRFLGPAAGDQACGEVGPGRLIDTDDLFAEITAALAPGVLRGLEVLVTAGPTREYIDPVRYLSNRSSGKMGYAIAQAAAEAGASVTLVSGPVALAPPRGAEPVWVSSAEEMYREVMSRAHHCDVLVAAAAVADYHCGVPALRKLKRGGASLTLTLLPTPDIVKAVTALARRPFTVAFAAETENLVANAQNKLEDKAVDMIAANDVAANGVGFDHDRNEIEVLWRGGSIHLAKGSKQTLARRLIRIIAERYRAKKDTA